MVVMIVDRSHAGDRGHAGEETIGDETIGIAMVVGIAAVIGVSRPHRTHRRLIVQRRSFFLMVVHVCERHHALAHCARALCSRVEILFSDTRPCMGDIFLHHRLRYGFSSSYLYMFSIVSWVVFIFLIKSIYKAMN